jgi:hypothetical protein
MPFKRVGEGRKFASAVIRRLAAGLIVVGLAVGIWALWPDDDSSPSPTTTPAAAETTTTVPLTSTTTTTTTTIATTSTVTTDVVETVEEAEAILRNLWFGWFEGIYNQDESRIREVVGTQSMLNAARDAFGAPFTAAPTPEGVALSQSELLRSDENCLVVWSTMDVSAFRGEGSESQMVTVTRWMDDTWRLATTWTHKEDLWETDCEGELPPLS